MTGNIRQGLGLVVVALVIALVGLIANAAGAGDFGGMLIVLAVVVALIALVKIAADLLRPQRD